MTKEIRGMAESHAQFVQQQLQSGTYQMHEGIVRAGLQRLQEHEEALDRVADALRCGLLWQPAGGVEGPRRPLMRC